MKALKKKNVPQVMRAEIDQGEVLQQLAVVEDELAEVVEKLSEDGTPMKIDDEDDFRVACALLIATVVKRDKIAEWKEGFMERVKSLVDYVESSFAEPETKAEEAEAYFRVAIAEYALGQEQKALSLREAAAHLPERDAKKAGVLLDNAKDCAPPKVPGISLLAKTKTEVIDEGKLPSFAWKKVIDMKAIDAALERGEKVPGTRRIDSFTVKVSPKNARD